MVKFSPQALWDDILFDFQPYPRTIQSEAQTSTKLKKIAVQREVGANWMRPFRLHAQQDGRLPPAYSPPANFIIDAF